MNTERNNSDAQLKGLALNEIQYRGQNNGWRTLMENYWLYSLTELDAKIMAHLVQEAKVTLPQILPDNKY